MRRAKRKLGSKSTGYGYVGRWSDGSLGWFLPPYLNGSEIPKFDYLWKPFVTDGERSYLCKITIEQVFDRKGRPRVRKIKPWSER